jgi:hypothetical protein
MYNERSNFDQLSIERTVKDLSNLGIRQSPLTWEKAKRWARQLEAGPEKALGWLILRYLVFRTTDQLESSLRQALKEAAQHFGESAKLPQETNWKTILDGSASNLHFYCSPPTLNTYGQPGKSGELIARLVNRVFKISKSYAYDFTIFTADERLLIVDDASFTGEQIGGFLDNYSPAKSSPEKIAIILAIAHETALYNLNKRHPNVKVFCGETISKVHCFESTAKSWETKGLWPYPDQPPIEVYNSLCEKHNLVNSGESSLGFGGLGIMVGYEHGIPDDSLKILWGESETWSPLIER